MIEVFAEVALVSMSDVGAEESAEVVEVVVVVVVEIVLLMETSIEVLLVPVPGLRLGQPRMVCGEDTSGISSSWI